MCLYTKNNQFSIAKENLTCYKVLAFYDGGFMTPYQKTFIPKNVIDGKIPFIARGEQQIEQGYLSVSCVIGGGFVHTYKSLTSAWLLKNHIGFMNSEYVCSIFECEIPKGTKYYEGEDDFFEASFASEKINFVKEMEL